jgi:hypothetical protein
MRSFFLSQDYLTTLERCPRQYQYVYVERLTTPVSVTKERAQEWGKRFHQLMQQQALGLPVGSLLGNLPTRPDHPDPQTETTLPPKNQPAETPLSETQFQQELAHCLHTLGEQEPSIFGKTAQDTLPGDHLHTDRIQQSEHSRTLLWQSLPPQAGNTQTSNIQTVSPDRWLLRVIYDRLVLTPHTAEILDWKTYPQPPDLHQITQHWQTRLYLFVLAETSAYAPEHLSMTYWFVRHINDRGVLSPQSYTIPYDRQTHEQTRQDLTHWIHRLTHWYRAYETGTPFPMLPESSPQCHTCPFNQRCQRSPANFQVNYNHMINPIHSPQARS